MAGVPRFGERPDVRVCWFAEQVCAKFDFCPVHALCEVHAYRPEGLMPAGKKWATFDPKGEWISVGERGLDLLSGLSLDLVANWLG